MRIRKIKGFTLMQVLIGMALFTIVLGIGSSVNTLFFQQYSGYRSSSLLIQSAATLNGLLNKDFSQSHNVRQGNEGITCTYSNGDEIFYKMAEHYIVRVQSGISDTFKIAPADIQTALNNTSTKENSLIDNLSFKTKLLDTDMEYSYTKLYGADIKMKQEEITQNGDTY